MMSMIMVKLIKHTLSQTVDTSQPIDTWYDKGDYVKSIKLSPAARNKNSFPGDGSTPRINGRGRLIHPPHSYLSQTKVDL